MGSHGSQIALPDAAAAIAQDVFAHLGLDQQFQGAMHDLAFGAQVSQLAGLRQEPIIDVDVGPDTPPIHSFCVSETAQTMLFAACWRPNIQIHRLKRVATWKRSFFVAQALACDVLTP